MEFFGQVIAWFADPATWSGRNGIPIRLWEHVSLSAASLTVGTLIALPVGLVIGHTGRGAVLAVSIANIGRAIPSLGLLGIVFPIGLMLGLGLGFWPSLIALVALAIPPIVLNTYVGLSEVDRDLVEAARGMGMREGQILGRLEIPIALPVILAGIRTSAVQVVATATLAAVISGGTLGHLILAGVNTGDEVQVFGSALLVAILAIATELTFGFLQRTATSPGLRARAADANDAMLRASAPAGS
jgi:osmoprotectant transport system permease protein